MWTHPPSYHATRYNGTFPAEETTSTTGAARANEVLKGSMVCIGAFKWVFLETAEKINTKFNKEILKTKFFFSLLQNFTLLNFFYECVNFSDTGIYGVKVPNDFFSVPSKSSYHNLRTLFMTVPYRYKDCTHVLKIFNFWCIS